MIRLGLCCIFKEEPIRFRQTTASALLKLSRKDQLEKLSKLCLENIQSLKDALSWVERHDTGAFRILSPLFPRMTHPKVAYNLDDLADGEEICHIAGEIKAFKRKHHIRLSLHPDQFNVLSSPHTHVVDNTIRELEYQGLIASLVGATEINIHAGGVYGNKGKAMEHFARNFEKLSNRVQTRLTLENDDSSYTPQDIIALCQDIGIPFVYDIHHHRCLPDGMSEQEATNLCIAHWQRLKRQPYFHISSPKNGYNGAKQSPHADYINPQDFPSFWQNLAFDITVDVEAKAKELAVLRLQKDLRESELK